MFFYGNDRNTEKRYAVSLGILLVVILLILAYLLFCPNYYLNELQGWRPLNGRPGLRVAVWSQGQSHMCAGLSLRSVGCTPALSVTQSAAAAAVCGLWRYMSDEL